MAQTTETKHDGTMPNGQVDPEAKTNFKSVLFDLEQRPSTLSNNYHSETSLQSLGLDDEPHSPNDPGIFNVVGAGKHADDGVERRRAVSQPGPGAGGGLTATAARAARRRPARNVAYADPLHNESPRESNDQRIVLQPIPAIKNGSGPPTPVALVRPPSMNNIAGYGNDLISPKIYASNGMPNRAFTSSNGDLRSLASGRDEIKSRPRSLDGTSLRSVETLAPPASSDEDKKKMFNNYLTVIMSAMYAIFLVTAGIIVFIADALFQLYNISEYYCLYLIAIGFVYIMYLHVDLRIYLSKASKHQKQKEEHEEAYEDFIHKREEQYGIDSIESRGYPVPPMPVKPLDHEYCFSQGRHAGSFYLKLGAAGFALGHLVHSVLLINVQISHMLNDVFDECGSYPSLVLLIIYPLYSIVQLFFIFKYSNVILIKFQELARIAWMHMIGSSLCFWIWTIVRETRDAIIIYANYVYGRPDDDEDVATAMNYDLNDFVAPGRFINVSGMVNLECMGSQTVNTIFQNFSPYLYPFTVEYSILIVLYRDLGFVITTSSGGLLANIFANIPPEDVIIQRNLGRVGIFYVIWSNIGHCPRCEDDGSNTEGTSSNSLTTNSCRVPTLNEENSFTSNMVIHADCHASNRGVFAGLLMVVISIAIIILSFVGVNSYVDEFSSVEGYISDAWELIIHTIMLVMSVFGYMQIKKLDVNHHPMSMLDDVLLFICLPPFFMDMLFTVVATIAILNVIKCINAFVVTIQVVIQTSLLIDGLRRCSNTRKLRRSKPGREIMMFMVICNVAMWLLMTFSVKRPDSEDERYEFYGKVVWSILGHISLPLRMFYRFHASVCFADIWLSAYKPGEH